jgi:hypothetical protein
MLFVLILNENDKEALVIDMLNKGLTAMEIATDSIYLKNENRVFGFRCL